MSVYKMIEIVGTSETSWEDAARTAIEQASESVRDMRVAEITKLDVRLDDGEIVEFRARVMISFKFEGSDE
ncbi:MAG: dodecin domain-containing protein [Anaerolineales bacterium]|uniref:dodecin family protein n=1 Tax=Promineifilum sp. TaxID=2664178 RepID=UPI001DA1A86A|nr:dodecin domain-containing protein [Anaerolineales bacterium]MCB8934978.1 dodecin domain-containing protein [Promineifilum sp.]MCO5178420.1 dodecin family protein [Promineifilum sp.]